MLSVTQVTKADRKYIFNALYVVDIRGLSEYFECRNLLKAEIIAFRH